MARSDSPRPASSGTAVGHRKPRTASTPPSGLALARPAAAPDAQRLARRTRVVIAGAAEAVVLVDAQGCIQHTNRQAAGLFGYTRQMLVGEPFHMLVPDWLPRDPAAAAGTPSARNRRSHDARACFGHHRDGHEFPIYLAATALPRAADGLVVIAIRQVQMWLPDDDDVAPDAVRRQERHTATALTRTLAFIRSRLALDRHSEALRAAKATETQLRGLQTLTDTALAHLDLDDLLPALLDQVREVMGVDHAIVLLLEEDGQHLRVRMARGPEAVLVADVQATVGVSFIGRIAATREPLIIEDVMSLPFPIQRSRRRARSAAGVPLLLQGRLVGVLSVTATEQQRFTRQDVELLQRVAERVTIAIERSQRYEDERRARAEAEAARA